MSYNRPYTSETDNPESWYYSSEFAMVEWLEQNGYDVTYTTDWDVAMGTASLTDHQVITSAGHDEYWSAAERNYIHGRSRRGSEPGFIRRKRKLLEDRLGAEP